MPCEGQTVGSLIRRVSHLLGDQCAGQVYHRWTKATLIDLLNDARCALVALRPDAFTQTVDMPLRAGSEQTLDPKYQQLVDVVSSGPDDAPASVGTADTYYTKALRGKKCLASDCVGADTPYVMQYASTNEKVPRTFHVVPPVPVGSTATVRANVVVSPPPYCPSDESAPLDAECQFVPAITEYMLYRAYSIDVDSVASEQASQKHHQAFYAMIDKAYLFAQRWGSGYYKGEQGDADPAFRGR